MLNSTTENILETTMHPSCHEVDDFHLVTRFWLAVVLGISLSLISIIFNSFVFVLFITSKQHRNSPDLYLLLLSLFDIFVAVTYITVLSNKVLIHWTASYTLKRIWISYMIPMFTVSHIAITASTFLITFAAIERYSATVNSRAIKWLQNNRKLCAFIAVMFGVITKGTTLMEIEVKVQPECSGALNEWILVPSSLVIGHPMFNVVWRFYVRNISTVLAPFFILLYLNAMLVYKLQEHNNQKKMSLVFQDIMMVKQKKERIRATTKTLIIIVCTYLMSNILNVIITIWEYLDATNLFAEYTAFYVIAVDVISLLTIVASCLRLPIYIICQPLLRKEMINFTRQMWTEADLSRRMTLIEASSPLSPQAPEGLLQTKIETDESSRIEFV